MYFRQTCYNSWSSSRLCVGPLLFLIFINDLTSVLKYINFYLLADDTNIYFELPELSKIEKVVNREFRKVRKWLEANRLALNVDKTNFVIFHSQQRRLTDHIVLKIGNKKIKQESYVKFLGVLLDSNLSWKFHLAELSKKLARTAGLFYKIPHYAPTETFILLYHGISAPFLSYGLPVWGSTYPSLLDSITVLQNRIQKIITFNEITAPPGPLFDSLQIPKVDDLFQLQVVSFLYECINSLAPIYFKIYLTNIHTVYGIGTRQAWKGDLYALRYNTTQYGIRSIHYSGVRLWNSLPTEIKESRSLPNFRKKLKSHFLLS